MYREPAQLHGTDEVTHALDRVLLPKFSRRKLDDRLEFRRYKPGQVDDDGTDVVPVHGAWARRWRNDVILHLGVPDTALDRLSALSLRVEQAVHPQFGHVWWFAPVNLHLVWSGQRLRERTGHLPGILEPFGVVYRGFGRLRIDNYDPRSNLLSITVVDLVARTLDLQARGRGGRLHKLIAGALRPIAR